MLTVVYEYLVRARTLRFMYSSCVGKLAIMYNTCSQFMHQLRVHTAGVSFDNVIFMGTEVGKLLTTAMIQLLNELMMMFHSHIIRRGCYVALSNNISYVYELF